jgi:hypothetical protein
MPGNHKDNVEQIKPDHSGAFPHLKSAISQEDHAEAGSHHEEAHISKETFPSNFERPNQRHTPCHHCSNERRGSDQFTNSETATVAAHGGKCREHIRTSISKCQECDACQTFTHTEDARYCAQVDAEKVGGRNPNRAEQETNPYHKYHKCDGLGV